MKWDVILGITSSVGLVHAIFLAFYLLATKKGDRGANFLLAAVLGSFALRIFKSTFYAVAGFIPDLLPVLGLISMSLTGPLMFLYIQRLQGKRNFSGMWELVHGVGPLIACSNLVIRGDLYEWLSYLMVIVIQFFYIAWIFVSAQRWTRSPLRSWIESLTIGFAIIEVVYFLQWTRLEEFAYVMATLTSSIVLLALTYLCLLRYDLLRKVHHFRLEHKPLAGDEEARLQLRKIILEEEAFRDGNFSLSGLSQTLGLPPSRISTCIRREFNATFPELINRLRLDYVTRQLQSAENSDKVEAIAYEAGYQSPSSFYMHFRKTFRMTPSEYRERVLQNLN